MIRDRVMKEERDMKNEEGRGRLTMLSIVQRPKRMESGSWEMGDITDLSILCPWVTNAEAKG